MEETKEITELRDNTEKCEGYKTSNCCCASITFSDICSECGEHCDTLCADCEDPCIDQEVF